MLLASSAEHLRPLWFRAGEDVLLLFGAKQTDDKVSELAGLPVFPMKTFGLALVTTGIVLTE